MKRPAGRVINVIRQPAAGAALASGLVSLAVYGYTTAPNVTLLDAGELIVAAQHFGVPHPPGYPLWTILAWFFQLLPLGNAAWEVALFSGVCGTGAVAAAAWLICSTLLWLLPEEMDDTRKGGVAFAAATGLALAFAFSVSMWTQAVIAEMYTLHTLLVVLYFCAIYRWVRDPARLRRLALAVFIWALGVSNHHLMLPMV